MKIKHRILLVFLVSYSIVLFVAHGAPVIKESRATLQGNTLTVIGDFDNVQQVNVYLDDGVTWSQMALSGDNLSQTGDLVRNYQVVELDQSQGSINFIVVVVLNPGVADSLQQVKFEIISEHWVTWVDVDFNGVE